MSLAPKNDGPAVAVAAQGLTIHVLADGENETAAHRVRGRGGAPPETEAHMPFRKGVPAETEAHMPVKRGAPPAETEAHMPLRRGPATETEAHGFRLSPADPAIDAYARLTLAFPAAAPEQVVEVRYRPAATPGGAPEVELHKKNFRDLAEVEAHAGKFRPAPPTA